MFSFQGTSPARVPEPKAKAKGVAVLRKEEAGKCTSTCEASAWNGKRNCRKLSTKAGTEAWKQAEGNADQRKPKGRSSTGKNRCEGKLGRREKKKQRLSSQNLNGNRTKEKGNARKTPQGSRKTEKGEHLWNSCGSEAGKDERKQTESQVHRTGKKARETRLERRGKT